MGLFAAFRVLQKADDLAIFIDKRTIRDVFGRFFLENIVAVALVAEFFDIFDGIGLARTAFEGVGDERNLAARRNIRLGDRSRLRLAIDAETAHVVEFVGSVDGFDCVFPTVGIDANRRFRADERRPRAHGIALRTDENAVGRGENRAVGLERGEREYRFSSLLILGKSHRDRQSIDNRRDNSFHIFQMD